MGRWIGWMDGWMDGRTDGRTDGWAYTHEVYKYLQVAFGPLRLSVKSFFFFPLVSFVVIWCGWIDTRLMETEDKENVDAPLLGWIRSFRTSRHISSHSILT
jgi:hypothetical protein